VRTYSTSASFVDSVTRYGSASLASFRKAAKGLVPATA
jgi:hypothetical protein